MEVSVDTSDQSGALLATQPRAQALLSTKAFETDEALAGIKGAPFNVTSVEEKEVSRNPTAPFTTSTLQQEAAMTSWMRMRSSAWSVPWGTNGGFIAARPFAWPQPVPKAGTEVSEVMSLPWYLAVLEEADGGAGVSSAPTCVSL
jgi:hypothetical protein